MEKKQYSLRTATLNLYCSQAGGSGARGGYSQKNWVVVYGPLPKTLTLFMTKICDMHSLPYL